MSTRNTSSLLCVTTTCFLHNIDEIISHCNARLDFEADVVGGKKSISRRTVVDQSLNTLTNRFDEKTNCFCFKTTTLVIPAHQLMSNAFQHRKNWHFSCLQKSSVQRFRNV